MSDFGNLNLEDMAGEEARLNNEGAQNNFLEQFVPMPDVKPGQTGTIAVRVLPPVKGGKLFQYNRVHTINYRKVHAKLNDLMQINPRLPKAECRKRLKRWKKKIEPSHDTIKPLVRKIRIKAQNQNT